MAARPQLGARFGQVAVFLLGSVTCVVRRVSKPYEIRYTTFHMEFELVVHVALDAV